jgi:hypothetical protein
MHRGKVTSQWLDNCYLIMGDASKKGLSAIAGYLISDISDSEYAERIIQWHRDVETGIKSDGYQMQGNGYHMFNYGGYVYLDCEYETDTKVLLTCEQMIKALDEFCNFQKGDIFNKAHTPLHFWVEYEFEGNEAERVFAEKLKNSEDKAHIEFWDKFLQFRSGEI